ncbi:MAG: hypothetical protein LC624_03530 [Halobacteriales archaeon]|nr:hypothetical protein [Halobacteriales archaeon]
MAHGFSYPTALAMRGDGLLVLEAGRFPRRPVHRAITPTGLAFAPHDFPGHADEMFVVMFSGTPPSNNRGEVDLVTPDFLTGE